jgi:hypothetical protein
MSKDLKKLAIHNPQEIEFHTSQGLLSTPNTPNLEDNRTPNTPNLESNYDDYYKGGKNSDYNKGRFQEEKYILSEYNVLDEAISKIRKENPELNKIRLFEFGCGDGRFHIAIDNIAKNLKKSNIDLEVLAYDITKVGLEEYANRIKGKSNINISIDYELQDEKSSKPQITGIYNIDNLTIKLIKGSIKTKPEEIADFLEKVDVTSAIFGPLAHIVPKSLRVEFLKMFNETTVGSLAITVPSDGQFKKHQEAFNMMRSQNDKPEVELENDQELQAAFLKAGFELEDIKSLIQKRQDCREAGDIKYKVKGTKIINQYHVFSESELKESFKEAGFKDEDIKIDISTIDPRSFSC